MTDAASSVHDQLQLGRWLAHRRVAGSNLGHELPAGARHAARNFLACARPEILDNALVVTVELVTNAATHGRGLVDLVMDLYDHGFTVEVRDRGDGVESLLRCAKQAVTRNNDMEGWSVDAVLAAIGEGGRGLLLVEEMSTSWDVRRCPGGKAVRATIAYPQAATS